MKNIKLKKVYNLFFISKKQNKNKSIILCNYKFYVNHLFYLGRWYYN